jgi:hypothetical protein
MAYVAITTGEITTGEPTTNSTWTKVKDNFTDLDTRITAAEVSVATDPMLFSVIGRYKNFVAIDQGKITVNYNLTVTGIFLICNTAGSGGSTTIDIKRSRSGGAYTSLLTTLPSVGYAAGADAISSNAVLNATYTPLLAGDIIRLDITTSQTGTPKGLMVRIDFTKN